MNPHFSRRRLGAAFAALLSGALLLACGGGGGGGGIGGTGNDGNPQDGTLRVSLTDAPACGYDQVNVTIDRIRVNRSATAADADGGWSEIVLSPARRVDLLTLTNGVLEDLGQTTLPAGKYTQLRLVLADNDTSRPYANSVVPTGGTETPLDTPSAQQSGLKLNVNIDVEPGKTADVLLDFDACKSVVKRGNSGRYNLKPVITVLPLVTDAGLRVLGSIDPALVAAGTQVSLQQAGVVVRATVPTAAGGFTLTPVPAGTYDLVFSAPGRVTAVVTGVPVVAGVPTTLNVTPLSWPASPTVAVAGTVTPATATVRALQTFTGGPTVEAAFAPVDVTNGAFTFALPSGAPVRAPYAAGATSYAFTADSAVAGDYTVEAASAGAVSTRVIDVAAPVPPLVINVP